MLCREQSKDRGVYEVGFFPTSCKGDVALGCTMTKMAKAGHFQPRENASKDHDLWTASPHNTTASLEVPVWIGIEIDIEIKIPAILTTARALI